jgi:hypothetical protein
MLEVDAATFAREFNRKPFRLHHNLCEHPLLGLDAVRVLARSLQDQPGEIYSDVHVSRVDQRWDEAPRAQVSPEHLVDDIVDAKAWVVIRRAETDLRYKALLDETVAEIGDLSGIRLQGKIAIQNAIIFVTSPKRITTYHIDRECNFILQIRGDKVVYVFDQDDRDVLPEEELERFWTLDNNAAIYKPEFQNRARIFHLRPGEGVHVPVNAPHWVQNGDDVSLTLSVNFQFKDLSRANQYRANFCLRKLGFRPVPPGMHRVRDSIKAKAVGGIWRMRGPLKLLTPYATSRRRN